MRIFIILIALFFVFATSVKAVENPASSPNNKFGIHIIDENDLDKARELVNSGGGDWGYITIVIREDERSFERWQEVFNKMRRMHLIPIIRVATKQTSEGWAIPTEAEINNWIAFLNSLNWVVKNRYVVVGNEPNQAHEWEGKIDPAAYASYLRQFASKLKTASTDFFVLPAGLDASAPNSKTTMTAESFLQGMIESDPNIFDLVDGWTSHSYPSPMPTNAQYGRATLRSFAWELNLLSNLGLKKKLPVFITETGWQEGIESIGTKIKEANAEVWSDDKVAAVTPFILNYKHEPYAKFSWLKGDGSPQPFYTESQGIVKTQGSPVQITNGRISGSIYLPIAQSGHGIYGALIVENTGQSIWYNHELELAGGEILTEGNIEPGQRKLLVFKFIAPNEPGIFGPSLQLKRNGVGFGNTTHVYVRVIKLFPLFGFQLGR